MKPFDSADASLPTASQLEFKIMKETSEVVTKESQNNGQLKMTPPDNIDVQNCPKKLLEIVKLNSSGRVTCDNSVKVDDWISSCSASEKENVVSANGLPHEPESNSVTQSEVESVKCVSRTEEGISNSNEDKELTRETEDLVDTNTEEKHANGSSKLVPGIADREEIGLLIGDVSECQNGPLSIDNNINGDAGVVSSADPEGQSEGLSKDLNEDNGNVVNKTSSIMHSDECSPGKPLVLDSDLAKRALDLDSKLTVDGDSTSLSEPATTGGGLDSSQAVLMSNVSGSLKEDNDNETAQSSGEILPNGEKSFDSEPISMDEEQNGDSTSDVMLKSKDMERNQELISSETPPKSMDAQLNRELNSSDMLDAKDSQQNGEFNSSDASLISKDTELNRPLRSVLPKRILEMGESDSLGDKSSDNGDLDSLNGSIDEGEPDSLDEPVADDEPDSLQEPPEEGFDSYDDAEDEDEPDSLDCPVGDQEIDSLQDPVAEEELTSRDSDSLQESVKTAKEPQPTEQMELGEMGSEEIMDIDGPAFGDKKETKKGSVSVKSMEDTHQRVRKNILNNMTDKVKAIGRRKSDQSHDFLSSDKPADDVKKEECKGKEEDGPSQVETSKLKVSAVDSRANVDQNSLQSEMKLSDDVKDTKTGKPEKGKATEKEIVKPSHSPSLVPADSESVCKQSSCEPGKSVDKSFDENKNSSSVQSAVCVNEKVKPEDKMKCSDEKETDTSVEKSFEVSKVSYRQLSSHSLSVTSNNRAGRGSKFEDDYEEDLRAMEESMWVDDIDKSRRKSSAKSSALEDVVSDNTEHREERLTRKRSSEDDASSETSKRTKISTTSFDEDSDLSSETSRDCDITSKRPSESELVDNQSKRGRGEESEKGKTYLSNLDKIIDQVATGVLSGDSDNIEVHEIYSTDSNKKTTSAESTEPKPSNPLPFMRKLHHEELKNLSRNDLEELVVQKLCEIVTERCNVGELRQRTQLLEQMVEQWRKKAQLFSKQIRDMEMVMKRFANDQKMKKDRIVLPVKITRSVGLQVHMGQTANQVGLPKSRIEGDGGRIQRRRSERAAPAPDPAPSSVNQPQKPPTPTSTPNTPQKTVSPVFPKTTVASTPPVPSPPVVRQVAPQGQIVKTVSTPVKTTPVRPVVANSSSSTNAVVSSVNSTARSTPTTSIANRVVKNSGNTPIAPKPSQDLIDLTDEEDRAKNSTLRNALTIPTDALIPTTASITSVLPSTAITTSVAGRGIRVVQPHQLTAGGSTTTAAILTPTGTTNTSGQRLAYLVPTSTMPPQQRQLLLASAPQQVRAGSVMSMSGRPTIVFKSAPVVSMSQAGMPPGTMVQAGVPTSSPAILRPNSALATLQSQARTGQLRMPSANMVTSVGRALAATQPTVASHPAPLPSLPPYGPTSLNLKLVPPKPELKISKVPTKNTQGIVLSWNMTLSAEHEEVASYQLYAYQEGNAPPSTSLWKKVGDVKALPLPMACTLTQFQEGHKYHFAVRAVDVHMRCGQFSAPGNIMLTRK